jgi:hypothetical protein
MIPLLQQLAHHIFCLLDGRLMTFPKVVKNP